VGVRVGVVDGVSEVGAVDGENDGFGVGAVDGGVVSFGEGCVVGLGVGAVVVGVSVGSAEGARVGGGVVFFLVVGADVVGFEVVGFLVGSNVGFADGARLGSDVGFTVVGSDVGF